MKINIASPCSARWEDMSGDERSRFCQHCQKHVYNFKAFSEEQIRELIRQKEGQVCARLYQRRDGTVITENCPKGIPNTCRKLKLAICSCAAGCIVFGSAIVMARFSTEESTDDARNQVEEFWDNAVWTVKGWFGVQPRVTMGVMPIANPPTQTSTSKTNDDNTH